jgi:osmotically-inducible protein OsmY
VEPFDQDHHASALPADDERTERVLEALRSHSATTALVDRLAVETVGSTVIVAGTVEDLVDEDEIVAVASSVDGVSEVDSRIEVAGLG